MPPRRLAFAVLLAELAAVAALLRSVAYDRWITVFMASLVLVGALAVRRGRTWGLGLSFAAAAWFPAAWLVGIAPPWFAVVGSLAALPFVLTSRALAQFDARATALLAALAAGLGGLGAVGWKAVAASVFDAVPLLAPSVYAHHGAALVAIVLAVVGVAAARARRRIAAPDAAEGARVRVADAVEAPAAAVATEAELDEEPVAPVARRAAR